MGKTVGEIAELRFLLKATEQGLIVSKPYGDNRRYDFITDYDGSINRVQVKSSFKSVNSEGRYKVDLRAGSGVRTYTSNEIDLFAIYVDGLDAFFLFPVEVLGTRCAVVITPETGKWRRFREAWVFLKTSRREKSSDTSKR